MSQELVQFEFDDDHGSTWTPYYGTLPRDQLERGVNGTGAELFARGLPLAADLEPFVARTAEASGAFIEELLRRSLVFAAEEGSAQVMATHLDAALRELVLGGGELTRNLLGSGDSA